MICTKVSRAIALLGSLILLGACGGGGGGGGGSSSSNAASSSGDQSVLGWGAPNYTAVDQDSYPSGTVAADGNALLVWGQRNGDKLKAALSTYDPLKGAWATSTDLDAQSTGIDAKLTDSGAVYNAGVFAFGARTSAGAWLTTWQYCPALEHDQTGRATCLDWVSWPSGVAKQVYRSHQTPGTLAWSNSSKLSFEDGSDFLPNINGMTLLPSGQTWLLNQYGWIAPIASEGAVSRIPTTGNYGSAVVASDGALYRMQAGTLAVPALFRYDPASGTSSTYTTQTPAGTVNDIYSSGRIHAGADGRATMIWSTRYFGLAGLDKYYVATFTPGSGMSKSQTVPLNWDMNLQLADTQGITLISRDSLALHAIRYDPATSVLATSQTIASNDGIGSVVGLALDDSTVVAWEGLSGDKAYVRVAEVDRTGKLTGGVQEVGVLGTAQGARAQLAGLWRGPDGKANLVWRWYGAGRNQWQASQRAAIGSWSAGADLTWAANTPATTETAALVREVKNDAQQTVGLWFTTPGVFVQSIGTNGTITAGTLNLPAAQSGATPLQVRLHIDGTVSVLGAQATALSDGTERYKTFLVRSSKAPK